MTNPLLSRTHRPTRPTQPVIDGIMALDRGRLHEICGTARRSLAIQVAARCTGPVIWIAPGWSPDKLHGAGVTTRMDPGRLIFAHPERGEDILWCAEEALRAGAVSLVVCEVPGPPGLTAVRRMHLAAETGGAEGKTLPTGLLLTPGNGGAPGVESRWRIDPRHGPAKRPADPRMAQTLSRWHLERLRARTAPPATWMLKQAVTTEGRISLVPAPAVASTPTQPRPRATAPLP